MKISDIAVDISDIGDVRHDIGDDRYIVDITVLDRLYHRNIRFVAHARVSGNIRDISGYIEDISGFIGIYRGYIGDIFK